jgi:hypothetical protein
MFFMFFCIHIPDLDYKVKSKQVSQHFKPLKENFLWNVLWTHVFGFHVVMSLLRKPMIWNQKKVWDLKPEKVHDLRPEKSSWSETRMQLVRTSLCFSCFWKLMSFSCINLSICVRAMIWRRRIRAQKLFSSLWTTSFMRMQIVILLYAWSAHLSFLSHVIELW